MQSEIKKNEEITASSEQAAKLKALFELLYAEGRWPDKLEDLFRADGADITREGYGRLVGEVLRSIACKFEDRDPVGS